MKKSLIMLSLVFAGLSLFAQSPEKISYQAVIRNASNSLITNTSIGMQISILQGSATGTQVYVERHTATTNANGLVTVSIGSGSPVTGVFASINWASGPYFIKTETDPTGGVNYNITGTSQLMSAPYALYAKNVQYNDDADASPTNEIQSLSINGNQLTISQGNTVTLPSGGTGGDNWGTQVAMTDATLGGDGLGATPLKIAQQGATNGQVLKWNGTTWLPADDQLSSGSSPTGPAGGDLSGTYPNPTIASNAVNSAKIADGTVTTTDIADGAITTPKMADGAVNSTKITDGGVATVDIADNSITTTKIVDGAVNTADIAGNAVTVAKLPVGASATTYLRGDGTWATPSSGITPGGNNGNIQFKQGNAFAGSDNLSWDNTNNRLGIGISSPQYPLHVEHNSVVGIQIKGITPDYASTIDIDASNGNSLVRMQNTGATNWLLGNFASNNNSFEIFEYGIAERMTIEKNTGNTTFSSNVAVKGGKGLIRSIDNVQRKMLTTPVTVNTTVSGGSTINISFVFSQSFTAIPVVYIGNATGGGFAEVVMSLANITTTGGKLFVYNPKSSSQSPNYTINVIAVGQE